MFKNIISQTPLTTQEANDFFGNINGENFQGDVTFLTSLRALLADRIAKDENLYLRFSSMRASIATLHDMERGRAARTVLGNLELDTPGYFMIYSFKYADEESNNAWLEVGANAIKDKYPQWHRVEKVNTFFRKICNVECFVNPEIKSTILLTDNIDVRRMHYLQQGIFAFLPWYFDKEAGASELEMELLKSLCEKTSDKYEEVIEKYAAQYDFATLRVRKLLTSFEANFEKTQMDNIKHEIENLLYTINDYNSRIGDFLRQKAEKEIILLGYQTKIAQADGDSELVEYFLANKSLLLRNVRGSEITFVVRNTLDFFDEDQAKRYIENRSSYFYSYCEQRGAIPRKDMELLMNAIFVKQSLKIQFCSAYRFDMRGNCIALRDYDYGPDCAKYMANPHIDRYECLGNYRQVINECLTRHDYISAIEQCVASCKSLNMADSAVMSEFSRRISMDTGKNVRCIVLPDGNVVRPKDAIAWLRTQQEAEKSNASEEVA